MESSDPIVDTGSYSRTPVPQGDIEGHHTEKWQNQAMYVGLHFPGNKPGKRRHRRRHHKRRPDDNDEPQKPPTPPSQRVQFILGKEEDDDDIDHQAHDMFCEMDELRAVGEDGDVEWKETARWIKFEEDVEEGGERWSKPHVATLSLHSLFELRKGILCGTTMLDVDAPNLVSAIDLVLDNMINSKQLAEEHRERVQEVLLSRHRHQHEKHHSDKKGLPFVRSLADIGKKNSEKKLEGKVGSVPQMMHMLPHHRVLELLAESGGHLAPGSAPTLAKRGSSKGLTDDPSTNTLSETPSQVKFNEHFLKKIPAGAEASNILVGEVDFLQMPIMAFIRLKQAVLLGDLTEVPVPTRFIFILLGPSGNHGQYHEIGRSIATLMSDEIFHDVAYKARERGDLLAGIDEFLDQVTVLPPGEWDPTIRIEPPKSVPSQEGRKSGAPKGGPTGAPTAPLPNGTPHVEEEEEEHGDPTLVRTGRIFGGLIGDIKRKAPWYLSDIKDALHIQCIASFFFMYFACLTPIITFGGLLGSATDNNMAAMESLLSGAICGISYHLFAGQPLTIIGSTGPVLVFETIVFHFCEDHHLNYLALRFWIGLWSGLILIIMVAFDLSALVRYITRFTEESFAALIALIFIYEAFKKLFHIRHHYEVDTHYPDLLPYDKTCYCIVPNKTTSEGLNVTATTAAPMTTTEFVYNPNLTYPYPEMWKDDCLALKGEAFGSGCDTPHYYPDVFFFSCLIFLGTFGMAMTLKNLRTSRFFPNKVRGIIADFSVMISIVVMVVIDLVVHLDTPKLMVPANLKPTRDDRGWVVDPFKNAWWTAFAAIIPAMLATILIFMDQQITAVIVNRKENKLKKGSGYHLDLFLIAIQIMICSVLGTPWFVAATVLSINHVRSLSMESESSAPGERPKFLGVREQRVTGVLVFLLVGLSVFMTPLLTRIPMPVLYGVFLFMGVSSLTGVQLIQRIFIVFMPPKYQPDYIYLRKVPLRRVHFFTIFQVVCLIVLWVIKTIKSISIVFPLMVLAMCFVRKALDWVFTRHELKWLDDIMPESHKREKEEKKKEIEEMAGLGGGAHEKVIEMTGGAVNIPLKDGKSINIPVDRITYDPKANAVNISDEMSKTAIWKQLVANESDPNIKENLRQRRAPNGKDSKYPKEPVKFMISEEDETEALMPEIRIDPPSKANTPEGGSPLNPDDKKEDVSKV